MGFTSISGASKKDVIQERIQSWENDNPAQHAPTDHNGLKSIKAVCIAHSVAGNCLWTVWEHTSTYIQPSPLPDRIETTRYIGLDLLACHKGYGWGYKDMCESMHPYYFNCPLKFLDMVPVACQKWRNSVRTYHQHKKDVAHLRRNVQIGQFLRLKGCKIPYVQVTQKRANNVIIGTYRGVTYRVPPRFIECVVDLIYPDVADTYFKGLVKE